MSSSDENSNLISDCSILSYFTIDNDNSRNIRRSCNGEEPISGPSRAPLDRYNVNQSLSRFFEEIDCIDSRAERSRKHTYVGQNAIHFEGSSQEDEASENPDRFTAYV
ncbi:hypothetical protein FQA39_LY07938 [Lamprigera yunnana]|nr:hypothetical protein FQA39_LY07938 [Lamprigera yunnana]